MSSVVVALGVLVTGFLSHTLARQLQNLQNVGDPPGPSDAGYWLESESHWDELEHWRDFENIAAGAPAATTDEVIPCPGITLVPPTGEVLQEEAAKGVVHAPKDAQLFSGKQYVFITGGAYTGTTGVLGLVSTSPSGTNLCSAKTNCCEGGWLMNPKQTDNRSDPNNPTDWKEVIQMFDQYWDQSKTIFIDKDPSYLLKFTHLFKDLEPTGARVSFVYIVNSPCTSRYQKNQFAADWSATATKVLNEINALKAAGARVHVIKNEELLGDPYGVVRGLLDFLPDLVSLDPTRTGVHDAPLVMEGDVRAQSLFEFVANSAPLTYEAGMSSITQAGAGVMAALGYTKPWFKKSSFVVLNNFHNGGLDFLED